MGHVGLVPSFATRLRRQEAIRVADGGRWQVDLVHVGDVVRAAEAALCADVSGAFNIASGTSVSTLAVAEMMVSLLGASRDLVTVDPPDGPLASGFPPLDIARAQRLLDYSPMTTRAGLANYLASG
jgi:nucleoside-diphosphate-sugar epimerase